MNQRKFFINQQRVKHCLWQKSQKFDHYFFSDYVPTSPYFFMDGMTNFERGLVTNFIFKTKKCFNFTNFFSMYCKGPSINDVTHNLKFLIPPSPSTPILLNRLLEYRHLSADPPVPPNIGDVIYGQQPFSILFLVQHDHSFFKFFSEKTGSVLVVVIFSTTALAIC